jgi:type VI protein secretion system component Hcp
MTTQRARHPRPEPPGRTQRGGPLAARAPAAARVLALQRQAGNRAVVALLARTPRTEALAQPKDTHAIVAKIGTIPLLSFSWGASGRRDRDGGPGVKELSLSSQAGSHSPALWRAAAEGTPLGTVEIVLMKDGKPYARIKLHGAVVSAYSTGAGSAGRSKPVETWSLNADGVEWEIPRGDDAGDGAGRSRGPAGPDVWDVDAPG